MKFLYFVFCLFVVFLFWIIQCSVFAQTINYNWSYGGSNNDGNFESRTIVKSSGSFITATSKGSIDGDILDYQGGLDIWVLSHDSNRNILWQKSIGGSEFEYPTEILLNQYGQIIVIGTTNSVDGHFSSQDTLGDAFILKMDTIGNLLWVRNFGGSKLDIFNDVVEDGFGNLYIVGASESNNGDVLNNNGEFDLWLMKMDSAGNVLWNKSLGGTGNEGYSTLMIDNGGHLILGARSDSNDPNFVLSVGDDDAIIIKLDSSGNQQWVKRYGGSSYDAFNSVTRSFNGGYIFTGFTYSNDGDAGVGKGSSDLWVVETDTSGIVIWSNRYGGTREDAGREILLKDNTYSVLGITESNDIDVLNYHYNGSSYQSDIWYLEIDTSSQLLWNRCFGSTWRDIPGCVNELTDGTVLISGSVSEADGDVSFLNGNNGLRDLWIVNFNPPTNLAYSISPNKQLTIFPNPFSGNLNVYFPSDGFGFEKEIIVRDVTGNAVFVRSGIWDNIDIDLSTLAPGAYFMECNNANSSALKLYRIIVKQ